MIIIIFEVISIMVVIVGYRVLQYLILVETLIYVIIQLV